MYEGGGLITQVVWWVNDPPNGGFAANIRPLCLSARLLALQCFSINWRIKLEKTFLPNVEFDAGMGCGGDDDWYNLLTKSGICATIWGACVQLTTIWQNGIRSRKFFFQLSVGLNPLGRIGLVSWPSVVNYTFFVLIIHLQISNEANNGVLD